MVPEPLPEELAAPAEESVGRTAPDELEDGGRAGVVPELELEGKGAGAGAFQEQLM